MFLFFMTKLKLITLHTLPLILGIILSGLFWKNNRLLFAVYAIINFLFIYFGKDQKAETLIALYGLCAALIVETIGTQISGYQKFTNPSFFGIPAWLPLTFSYGFILMKRMGLIISTGSPWSPKL